ncbi:MAG: tetratricopeptide repeat protein [Gammaproteobacteria bacterium]|nr:tetratricopeptide repeat protein [Gammaproteobacteria bacterium]
MYKGLLVSLLIAACCTTTNALAGSIAELQEIQSLLQKNQTRDAIQVATTYLRNTPNDPDAILLLSSAYIQNNSFSEARNMLNKYRQQLEHHPQFYNNMAFIYYSAGDDKNAVAMLELGIKNHPAYAALYDNLSSIYAFKAKKAYEKAINDESNTTPESPPPLKLTYYADFTTSSNQEAVPQEPTQSSNKATALTQGEARRDIEATISGWATAWSRQDAVQYLSFYSESFATPPGVSRSDWQYYRRDRLKAPSFIEVKVSNFDIVLSTDSSLASVHFLQHYRSNTLDDKIVKQVVLQNTGNSWKIISENVSN